MNSTDNMCHVIFFILSSRGVINMRAYIPNRVISEYDACISEEEDSSLTYLHQFLSRYNMTLLGCYIFLHDMNNLINKFLCSIDCMLMIYLFPFTIITYWQDTRITNSSFFYFAYILAMENSVRIFIVV